MCNRCRHRPTTDEHEYKSRVSLDWSQWSMLVQQRAWRRSNLLRFKAHKDTATTIHIQVLFTIVNCATAHRALAGARASAAHALNYRHACMERLPHKDIYILGVNAGLCPQTGKIMHTHVYIYSRRCRVYKTCMHVPTLALFTENINFLPFKGLFGLVENLSERFSGNWISLTKRSPWYGILTKQILIISL